MDEPPGLDDKISKEKYKVVRKKKTIILPNRNDFAMDELDIIFEEDQTDNEYTVKIHHMTNDQLDNYLHLLEQKPY